MSPVTMVDLNLGFEMPYILYTIKLSQLTSLRERCWNFQAVIKYADNILKNFATSVSIVRGPLESCENGRESPRTYHSLA